MSFFRLSVLIAALVVAGTAWGSSNLDIPSPSKQQGRPYQKELTNSCPGSACNLNFPVVPAHSRLDLSLANCGVQGAGDLSSMALFLYQGNTIILSHELIQAQAIVLGSNTRRLFSEPVEISIGAGRHLTASVLLESGTAGLRCSIFGTLVTGP